MKVISQSSTDKNAAEARFYGMHRVLPFDVIRQPNRLQQALQAWFKMRDEHALPLERYERASELARSSVDDAFLAYAQALEAFGATLCSSRNGASKRRASIMPWNKHLGGRHAAGRMATHVSNHRDFLAHRQPVSKRLDDAKARRTILGMRVVARLNILRELSIKDMEIDGLLGRFHHWSSAFEAMRDAYGR